MFHRFERNESTIKYDVWSTCVCQSAIVVVDDDDENHRPSKKKKRRLWWWSIFAEAPVTSVWSSPP